MSDQIKHECGIAMIRLLKPLEYYHKKYGTSLYGMEKLQLLLQKMRNRGQDGAGIATIKLHPKPGKRYISRRRSISPQYLKDVFDGIYDYFRDLPPEKLNNPTWLKDNLPYTGELLMGHLRYGTHGKNTIETCHPFLRQNNWISRNLVVAGNFNLTNVDELFDELVTLGQYPKERSDTVTVLEKIGHFLDDEVHRLHTWYKPENPTTEDLNNLIIENLDVQRLLKRASKKFDGGYVIGGMIGHGDSFMMRDPNGIRPAYYYYNDEIVVMASERPAIQTAFDVHFSKVNEVLPGHALIIKRNGEISQKEFIQPQERRACSFERIYFSRGTDKDIYEERKKLGEQLADKVLEAVGYDFKNTVFSYIPNTAETSFLGLVKGVEKRLNEFKKEKILSLNGSLKEKKLAKLLSLTARIEKIVIKDAKLRTFITADDNRGELVSHIYDVTYGVVKNEKDNLVLIDDSIVRGTTLKDSIIQMVARLRPKKIVIVSSAPQIRFPDCYGIDMSKMKEFVAFRALVALLNETGQKHLLKEAYKRCKKQEKHPEKKMVNVVQELYDLFPYEDISKKIAEIITPKGIKPKVEVIYQPIEDLHKACPNHNGDWYFSGNYPTAGGCRVANRAFINYMENSDERAY
ncbi:MAG TPA: amidophosphoribosyltransferase [Phaeodactylibacter sp.]|nr:amidophosphoribosyltransferase [Phaeodactylibacter sp.]